MARKVFKYPIPKGELGEPLTVTVHRNAVIKKVGKRGYDFCLWAEVDDQQPLNATRTLAVVGTGHPVPDGYDYFDTILDMPWIWHVYVRPNE